MTEEIYIDGTLMDLDAGKTSVQMIFQSPVMTDFQSVVSNRTSNVTLPLTQHNLRAIGYVGTQADSNFPYTRHSVVYKRDGMQLLSGFAVLMSIKASTITFCFTWGNVKAMETLFAKKLRELSGTPYTTFPASSPYTISNINHGGGREGVGIPVGELLTKIEAECGVSGLEPLKWAAENVGYEQLGKYEFMLGLTTRNGNTTTRARQCLKMPGLIIAGGEQSSSQIPYALFLSKGSGGQDLYGQMMDYGCIRTDGASKVRIKITGKLVVDITSVTGRPQLLDLYLMRDTNGYATMTKQLLARPTSVVTETHGSLPHFIVTYDNLNLEAIFDIAGCQNIRFAVCIDTNAHVGAIDSRTAITNFEVCFDPSEGQDVLYGTGLQAYPLYPNLPDITCGQLIKNLLWLTGRFAYSQDGRSFQLVSFNDIMANKANARDWTQKMRTANPTERQTKLDGTAQRNLFRYAEADYYDNTQYQGVLPTEDETINDETEYCKSDFAITPENKIPVWVQDEDGEWDFGGDGLPTYLVERIVYSGAISTGRYRNEQRWSWILDAYYAQYAAIIRKPVVLTAEFVLTTYDLYSLDMTIPVYLQQTGHYYLVRKLTTKSGGLAEAELIQI